MYTFQKLCTVCIYVSKTKSHVHICINQKKETKIYEKQFAY